MVHFLNSMQTKDKSNDSQVALFPENMKWLTIIKASPVSQKHDSENSQEHAFMNWNYLAKQTRLI